MDIVPDTFPSLFWGYTVMWLCIVIYIATLVCRMGRIEKKLKPDNE